MSPIEAIEAAEKRAFALRMTMGEVCQFAGIAHSTWSRAKKRGFIRAKKIKQVEDALGWLEDKQAREAAA